VIEMIEVVCPACTFVARVPDTAAGAQGRCRKCGNVVRVPAATARVSAPASEEPRRRYPWESEMPKDVQEAIKLQPLIGVAIFFGYVFPPLGVPLQIAATTLLVKALGRQTRWPWIAVSCLPWIGLVPLYRFNSEVSSRLYKARTNASADPLHSVERDSYLKLLKNWKVARNLFCVCLFATPLAGVSVASALGVLAVTAAVGWYMVWNLMQIHAVRKKLALAGIVSIVRSKSPLAEYDADLLKAKP
jgi:hypothetical protein